MIFLVGFQGCFDMRIMITGIMLFQFTASCLLASDNSLDSKKLFLESMQPNTSDENQILEVVNLKHFYDVGVPVRNWYDQIIRIKFNLGFRPAMVELAKNGRLFELHVKYTVGEKIRYNDHFYFASDGLKKYQYTFDTTSTYYNQIVETFKVFNFFSISPKNVSMSAFRQDIEFYSNWTQDAYISTTVWGKPDQNFLREGIKKINTIVNVMIQKETDTKKVFERWNNEVAKWNKK